MSYSNYQLNQKINNLQQQINNIPPPSGDQNLQDVINISPNLNGSPPTFNQVIQYNGVNTVWTDATPTLQKVLEKGNSAQGVDGKITFSGSFPSYDLCTINNENVIFNSYYYPENSSLSRTQMNFSNGTKTLSLSVDGISSTGDLSLGTATVDLTSDTTAITQTLNNSTTKVATTQFVQNQIGAIPTPATPTLQSVLTAGRTAIGTSAIIELLDSVSPTSYNTITSSTIQIDDNTASDRNFLSASGMVLDTNVSSGILGFGSSLTGTNLGFTDKASTTNSNLSRNNLYLTNSTKENTVSSSSVFLNNTSVVEQASLNSDKLRLLTSGLTNDITSSKISIIKPSTSSISEYGTDGIALSGLFGAESRSGGFNLNSGMNITNTTTKLTGAFNESFLSLDGNNSSTALGNKSTLNAAGLICVNKVTPTITSSLSSTALNVGIVGSTVTLNSSGLSSTNILNLNSPSQIDTNCSIRVLAVPPSSAGRSTLSNGQLVMQNVSSALQNTISSTSSAITNGTKTISMTVDGISSTGAMSLGTATVNLTTSSTGITQTYPSNTTALATTQYVSTAISNIPAPPASDLSSVLIAGNTANNTIKLSDTVEMNTMSKIGSIITDGVNTTTVNNSGISMDEPSTNKNSYFYLNDFLISKTLGNISTSCGSSSETFSLGTSDSVLLTSSTNQLTALGATITDGTYTNSSTSSQINISNGTNQSLLTNTALSFTLPTDIFGIDATDFSLSNTGGTISNLQTKNSLTLTENTGATTRTITLSNPTIGSPTILLNSVDETTEMNNTQINIYNLATDTQSYLTRTKLQLTSTTTDATMTKDDLILTEAVIFPAVPAINTINRTGMTLSNSIAKAVYDTTGLIISNLSNTISNTITKFGSSLTDTGKSTFYNLDGLNIQKIVGPINYIFGAQPDVINISSTDSSLLTSNNIQIASDYIYLTDETTFTNSITSDDIQISNGTLKTIYNSNSIISTDNLTINSAPTKILKIGSGSATENVEIATQAARSVVLHLGDGINNIAGSGVHINNGVNSVGNTQINNANGQTGQINIGNATSGTTTTNLRGNTNIEGVININGVGSTNTGLITVGNATAGGITTLSSPTVNIGNADTLTTMNGTNIKQVIKTLGGTLIENTIGNTTAVSSMSTTFNRKQTSTLSALSCFTISSFATTGQFTAQYFEIHISGCNSGRGGYTYKGCFGVEKIDSGNMTPSSVSTLFYFGSGITPPTTAIIPVITFTATNQILTVLVNTSGGSSTDQNFITTIISFPSTSRRASASVLEDFIITAV